MNFLRDLFLAAALFPVAVFAQAAPAPGLPPPPPPPDLFPKNTRPAAPPAPAATPAPVVPRATPLPTPAPQPGPWKTLFDGKAITGLRGLEKPEFLKAGWKIEDGALALMKEIKQSGRQTGGDLMTTEAYSDFELSFAWKMGVSGDSGVMYLARGGLGQKPVGHEFQLIDDVRNPDGLKGGPIKRTGGLYGILPPGENKQLNDGAWNEARLIIQGNHVEHWINDEKVLEYELGSQALQKAVMASRAHVPPGFGTKFKTPLIFLDQGEDISFRNIKIRLLPPASIPTR